MATDIDGQSSPISLRYLQSLYWTGSELHSWWCEHYVRVSFYISFWTSCTGHFRNPGQLSSRANSNDGMSTILKYFPIYIKNHSLRWFLTAAALALLEVGSYPVFANPRLTNCINFRSSLGFQQRDVSIAQIPASFTPMAKSMYVSRLGCHELSFHW